MHLRSAVTVAACVLCASQAQAHHSRALYDMATEVVFDGTVTRLEWTNPHISMTVATKGADGAVALHEIEVMSVSEARSLGLSREAIAEGSHVVVRAHPGRGGPTARAVGLDVKTADGTSLPLNTDAGFGVRPSAVREAQSLAGRWSPTVAAFQAAFDGARKWPFSEAALAGLTTAFTQSSAVLGICADYPPPLLSFFPDLREIEIGPSSVVIRSEAQGQNLARTVHLDQSAHPAGIAPSLLGHSIGRWEGQSLVVDTVAFEPHVVGIMIGVPSSPAKHLVEHFTLMPDKLHLRYDVTVEDPQRLTAPASLSVQWEYRPDLAPSGVACDPEAARKVLQQ